MDTSNSQINRPFLFGWVLANIAGLPLLLIPYNAGFFLMLSFAVMSDGGADESMAYVAMAIGVVVLAFVGAIVGTCLGFLQWLALRNRISKSGKWIVATATGMAAGAPLGAVIYGIIFAIFVDRPDGAYFSFAYEYLAFGPALGLAIAVSQGSLLKRRVKDTRYWTVGLPILITLGMLFADLNRVTGVFIMPIHGLMQRLTILFPNIKSIQVFFVFEVLTAVVAVIFVSVVTGILLDWLLQFQTKQALDP